MPELKATLPAATTKSSYNIRHFKAMHYPGRWPGWGGAFQWWGGGTYVVEASAFSGGGRRGFCGVLSGMCGAEDCAGAVHGESNRMM